MHVAMWIIHNHKCCSQVILWGSVEPCYDEVSFNHGEFDGEGCQTICTRNIIQASRKPFLFVTQHLALGSCFKFIYIITWT